MAKKLSPRAAKIIGYLLVIVSAIAISFAINQTTNGFDMRESWNKATAKVTRLERHTSHGRRGSTTIYTAWFSFWDDTTKRSYTVKSKIGMSHPTYRSGQMVEILYPTDHPENAVINSVMEIFLLAIISGAVGLLSGIFGILLCSYGRKGAE